MQTFQYKSAGLLVEIGQVFNQSMSDYLNFHKEFNFQPETFEQKNH